MNLIRHLHISKPKLEISEDESLNSGINTPSIRYSNEANGRVHSKWHDTNRQEFAILHIRG